MAFANPSSTRPFQRQERNPQGYYPNCAFCNKFAQKSALVTLLCYGNLGSLVPQGAKHQIDTGSKGIKCSKQAFRSDFLKKVNALLNAGPGQILIHGHERELCFFDEQVDSSLMSMLCEDSIFNEKFERFTLNDTHITFRVKPSKRKAISTFAFNSKLYLHKGLVDPTQAQIKYLMANERDKPPAFDKPRKPDLTNLEVGQDLIFPWSMDMQAKMIQPSVLNVTNKRQSIAVSERFVNHWWNELKLPNYIAAFSKQPYGGSFFIGLKVNEKEYGTKWKQVKNMDGIGEVFGTRKRVWIDDKNNQVLHFCTEEDVPKLKVNTRTYTCQGVQLSQEDCKQIEKNLEGKLKDHVEALPNKFLPHVKWAFYQLNSKTSCVKNEKTLFIIEAEIQPFYGRDVFFQETHGPEAYTTKKRTRPAEITCMNYQEWLGGI